MDEHLQSVSTAMSSSTSSELSSVSARGQKLSKVRKTRRGRGSKRCKYNKLTLFGNNINGLSGKWESLLNALQYLDSPNCILIQETKVNSEWLKKINGYDIFSKPRKNKDGGGLITIIKKNLEPSKVPIEHENSEILVIEVSVSNHRIWVINAYGPQEYDCPDIRRDFWLNLEQVIVRASNAGCSVLIQMDANAKLGKGIIPNDPNVLSANSKLLLNILERQNLDCLNTHPLCEGTITRYRRTVSSVESSVLDYVIASKCLSSSLRKMVIDEKRELTMTKYANCKGKRVIKESDHNSIFVQFNINIKKSVTSKRVEIFYFKNLEAQKKFRDL